MLYRCFGIIFVHPSFIRASSMCVSFVRHLCLRCSSTRPVSWINHWCCRRTLVDPFTLRRRITEVVRSVSMRKRTLEPLLEHHRESMEQGPTQYPRVSAQGSTSYGVWTDLPSSFHHRVRSAMALTRLLAHLRPCTRTPQNSQLPIAANTRPSSARPSR